MLCKTVTQLNVAILKFYLIPHHVCVIRKLRVTVETMETRIKSLLSDHCVFDIF